MTPERFLLARKFFCHGATMCSVGSEGGACAACLSDADYVIELLNDAGYIVVPARSNQEREDEKCHSTE